MCSIKENIFENIDTKEKAYWLGFLYADGNVSTKGNRIGFSLSEKDKILLEKFCDFVGGDRKRIVKYDTREILFYYVYSKKMKSDLISVGVVPNKTYRPEFPRIKTKELFLAFILGFYDGDGSEGAPVICSGNIEFLKYCADKLNINEEKIRIKKNKYGSVYSLYFCVENFKYIMENYKNSLERKRHISTYFEGADYEKLNMNMLEITKMISAGESINYICEQFVATPYQLKHFLIKENLKIKEISTGVLKLLETFPTDGQKINYCKCGKEIYKGSNECKKCAGRKQPRKFEVEKEILEKMVNEMPMVSVAKIFEVSDTAVRRRCKILEIPLGPRRGYWTRKKNEES